jgi:hypothetical protein
MKENILKMIHLTKGEYSENIRNSKKSIAKITK